MPAIAIAPSGMRLLHQIFQYFRIMADRRHLQSLSKNALDFISKSNISKVLSL